MADRAAQSLLPGAPHPEAERKPAGIYAIDLACSRLGHVGVDLNKLLSIEDCPASLLPWLAWSLGIAQWNSAWTEEEKRQALRDNLNAHLIKGTKQVGAQCPGCRRLSACQDQGGHKPVSL